MPNPLKKPHTLEDVPEAVIVADIVHTGDKLILPEACSLTQAKSLIERRMQYEQESVIIDMTYDVFPWDGAHAFAKVLTDKYGWAPAEATKGFFGDQPPQLISIETDHDKTAEVPWGQFVQQFNEKTRDLMGTTVPVIVTIYSDRTFEFILKSPPASVLLKQAEGFLSGAALRRVRTARRLCPSVSAT